MTTSARSDPYGFRQEAKDLMRAIAGGAIVGLPLLYTMEMWFHGGTLSPWHQLAVLGAMLVVNYFFCLVSGFREDHDAVEAAMQAVTSVGIGLVLSLAILWLIGDMGRGRSFADSIGKILLEASAVSLGVSFANTRRGESRVGEEAEGQPRQKKPSADELERRQLREDLLDLGATIGGSTVFALNIAPTEEVLLIASRLSPAQLLALLAATALLCYVILYASGFEDQPVHVPSVFQSAAAETIMTVAISLLTALSLLWLLGERETFASGGALVGSIVVLGLPASVGGAAGRLIT